jgi:anaerobic magnesium-protoporphyrin IX monomethyl ester cyclase
MRVVFLQKQLPQEMLGIGWLSTSLARAGHEAHVVLVPDSDWETKLRKLSPGLIGVSATTGDHIFYQGLAARAKEVTKAPIIFGGPHATFVPSIVENEAVDFACRGEGELSLAGLATALEKGDDWTGIPNLSYFDGAQRIDNPVRPLACDLDALGFPDRAPLYEAGACYRDSDRKIFLTQRGCLYACSFCFHHAWRDKIYEAKGRDYLRKRTVDHVLAEIEDVRSKWPLRFIHFLDDIFNIDDAWLEEFCARYPKAVGLPFDVILRTNLTTPEHAKMLRAAGCISARLAFESASDHVRNRIYRKGTTLDDLRNSSRYLKSEGIRLTTLNLLGSPGASLDDELATLDLNVECDVDHPLCSLLQPYPETDINEITAEMGYAVDSFDAFPEKFNRTTSIQFDNRVAIENLHKLFPLAVRFPWLRPIVKKAIRSKRLSRLYLAAYLLWTEYLVCEQNSTVANAIGNATWRDLPPIDFVRRVAQKTSIKIRERLFGQRLGSQRLALEMETDTIAHAGG